jgi:hypothetical protein
LPGRSLLFVACYLAARSRLPYRLAMNKAIAEFTRLTGEPMSVGAAKRILLDWRWEGVVPWWPWKSKGKPPPPRLRRFVMLPEFTDNPAPPVAPAMVFLDPEREYRCISTGRMVRLDPETIKLVKDMAPRSDAKVLFALSVKVGKPPRFPKMKPTIRRVSPGHLS